MGKNEGKEIKTETHLPGRVAQEFEVQAGKIGTWAGPRWQRKSGYPMFENQKKDGLRRVPQARMLSKHGTKHGSSRKRRKVKR